MGERLGEIARAACLSETDREVERVGPGVGEAVDDRADVLDLDVRDAGDTARELAHPHRVRNVHGQLVDDPHRVTLEDVDADQVGADLPERAGERPEGTGPVRQPRTQHVSSHTGNLRLRCERRISTVRTVAEGSARHLTPQTTAASFTTGVASTLEKPASRIIFSHAAMETGRSWKRSR